MSTAARLTQGGFDLLSKAIAGKKLTFLRAEIGDSIKNNEITIPTTDEQFNMTALLGKRMELPLAAVEDKGNGMADITFRVTNETLANAIAVREIGIFAKIDNEPEKLYCYFNAGQVAEYLTPPDDMLIDIYMTVVTIIDKAANITAVIDTSANYLTRAELTEHIQAADPHPNLLNISKATFLAAVF